MHFPFLDAPASFLNEPPAATADKLGHQLRDSGYWEEHQLLFFISMQADEKLNVLSVSSKSVIPESAAGGCPESRENNSLLDTGSRLRLVRYDVWGLFQAFSSACIEMKNSS